jgi:hypothetical protein
MVLTWKKRKKKGMLSKFVHAESRLTTGMSENRINIMEWIDREEWRIQIKL